MAIRSKKLSTGVYLNTDQTNAIQAGTQPLRLGFVLDQSSSMVTLTHCLINSFNAILADQGVANVTGSVLLFDSEVKVLAQNLSITEIPRLNRLTYKPQNSTALLDGIGQMISLLRDSPGHERTLVAIFTDGLENCSSHFSHSDILRLIAETQAIGWQFVFVTPANGREAGAALGIPPENIVDFELCSDGLRRVLAKLSRAIAAYRLGDRNYALLLNP